MKKRKSKNKINFLCSNKLSFLKQKKNLLAVPIIIVISTLFLNSQFLKNTIQTTFAADLSAIVASSGADINLTPGDYTFSGDLTIPAGKTLHYERGAIIHITNGQTLFFNGGMDDHLYKIFDDQNTDLDKGVKFSAGNVMDVRPEWWGARVDNVPSTNVGEYWDVTSVAITKAINSHIDHTTNVIFSSGAYYVKDPVVLRGHISLFGQQGNGGNTGIVSRSLLPYVITDAPPIDGKQGGTISGLSLSNRAVAGATDTLHFANGTGGWRIVNCNIYNYGGDPTGWGIYLENINDTVIENNRFLSGRTGALYMKGTNIQALHNEVQHTSSKHSAYLSQCENCHLSGNVLFSGPGDTGEDAILLENCPTAIVVGNKTDFTRFGMKVIGSGGRIEANVISDGFYATNLSNTTIVNNLISCSAGNNGILADSVSGNNVVIKNNRLLGCPVDNIQLNNISAGYPDVSGNTNTDETEAILALDSNSSPDVLTSSQWQTQNSSPTSITDFTNAPEGKEIFIVFQDGNTTVKFSGATNLRGNGGADWQPAVGDHMYCKKSSSSWACNCFKNSP